MQSSEIKKILVQNGLHVYNFKEEANWICGNKNNKLVFEIRNENSNQSRNTNENGLNIDNLNKQLGEYGLNININEGVSTITEKKPDMFPVGARWNDTNLRSYHVTVENNKKPEKTDYKLKTDMIYDRNLIAYKNDKVQTSLKEQKKNKEVLLSDSTSQKKK